jgi:hypothetical protein
MLLTPRHLATLRAALQFWKEEMGSHSVEFMQPYFDVDTIEPLTIEEITALDRQLKSDVRYVICDPQREQIDNTTLFTDVEQAQEAAGGLPVGTVLLGHPEA